MVDGFSSLRKLKTSTNKEKKSQSPRSSAAFDDWVPPESLAPPTVREASSLAAPALSCLSWTLVDLASLAPFSGRTR